MAVKPISPAEVRKATGTTIPDAVFEVFNELITERWDPFMSVSFFEEDEAKNRLAVRGIDRQEVAQNGWLHVLSIYRVAGWNAQRTIPSGKTELHFVFGYE